MIADLLLGFGFVAIVEGLAFALAPGHVRAALEVMTQMDPERRRLIGLLVVAAGVALVWLARA